MRAFRLSIAAGFVILAACSGSNTTPIVPIPTAAPVLQRGKIDALFKVGVLTKSTMTRGRGLQVASGLGGPPQCDVTLYSMVYETIGVHGEPAIASGAFYVPGAGCKGPFPIVGYAHGTIVVKRQSMTNALSTDPPGTLRDIESIFVAAIYAAHGYAAAATDYLGFGLSTYPYHPYVHAESEASAVIDGIRAARNAAKRLHVPLSGRVFLNGYSQGGHSTLATQRAIERDNPGEFDLRGVAPASGPYALNEWLHDRVAQNLPGASVLMAFTLPAYQKVYGDLYSSPSDVFQEPYAKTIDTLLPLPTLADQAKLNQGALIPLDISKLLTPSFTHDYLTNPSNEAAKRIYENALLHGWSARAPLFFCGGKRDPSVPFKNSVEAYAYFKHHGRSVTLEDVDPYIPPGLKLTLYHDAVLLFCEPLARKSFFDPRR
jgi:pimeloyl-ACP methyl ester carboxylesterase